VSQRALAAGRGLAALLVLALAACTTVPVTGRSQFNMLSPQQDMELGAQAYQETLSKVKLNDSHPQFAMVKRVCERLAQVAEAPTAFQWEVHLIQDDKTVNAWCMPGGKMAVYTGILPVTKDETGLAVVMGHEIAHAVARHGTERISTEGLGELALGVLAQKTGTDPALWSQVKALGFSLPWGRKQELEADHIGLIYMAKAGYDPRQAIEFWQRMAAQGGGKPPEFLSTHPSDETRIDRLQELMPKALKAYRAAGGP
jgi:predicted Zn-dependent protease